MELHGIFNVLIAFVDSTWLLILLVLNLSPKANEEQRLYSRHVPIMLSLGALMKEGSDKYSRPPNKPIIEQEPDAVKKKTTTFESKTWQCLIKSGLIGKTRRAPVEQCQRQTHPGREGLIGKTKCLTCGTSEGEAGLGPN